MSRTGIPIWLTWARDLQAIAQTGLSFATDPYDIDRYRRVEAIAAEIMGQHGEVPAERCRELFAAQAGYTTPKVDVRGIVFRDEKVLLVRERTDGLWTPPGGWADVGESPSEAVVKEVREESGFEVRAERLLAVLDRDRHPHPPLAFGVYKLFILCTIVGGAAIEAGDETDGVGFFGEHELPALSLTRVVPAQIARMFEMYRSGELKADLD